MTKEEKAPVPVISFCAKMSGFSVASKRHDERRKGIVEMKGRNLIFFTPI